MNKKALFSSKKLDWETPQWLFDWCNRQFGPFELDAAATESNSKCKWHFGTTGNCFVNGLTADWWSCKTWLNPPYGRGLSKWVRKAYEESLKGGRVICLIPARTDTRYWHDYVMKSHTIVFLKGRVRFVGASNSAPFPSCIVIFDKSDKHEMPYVATADLKKIEGESK